MNRIDARFRVLRTAGRKGFVAYICAGDPNLRATAELTHAFERAGVDVVELGVPFSDPLADGVVNQLAAERALRGGTTLAGVLKTVAGLRRSGCRVPIVLYAYYNVLHHYGLKKFVRDAAAAGVDGVLALDLPPEEADAYEASMKRAGLHPIYLVAPTTPATRVHKIARHASGFIYYVSREGVTGMQKKLAPAVTAHVATIRKHSRLPVAIGFGISNPSQARQAATAADAVVVGSAIVNQIAKSGNDRRLAEKVGRFVAPMVNAVKSVRTLKRILATVLIVGAVMGGGCQRKETGKSDLQRGIFPPSWPREFFQPTGAKALVWYQVYGHFSDTIEISRGTYRCTGVPAGIEVGNHARTDYEEAATSFLKQPFFVAGLRRELPKLASAVETAPDCTIIRGEVPDSTNLDYLRDVVGLVTWFLDNGAVAVLDPQTLTWYDREKWRSRVFEPNGSVPTHHVLILDSEERDAADKNFFWFHTRGMRKFARPDLSVHNVPAQYRDAVMDLLNRLIEAQAFGQVIAEGQSIKVPSLPQGMTGHHAGNLDDPDFNNTHIEMQWPK